MDNVDSLLFWRQHLALLFVCVLIIGLVIGSFVNVVILRLPVIMERAWRRECRQMLESEPGFVDAAESDVNLINPPSTCPKCGHRIRAWENIPLISYAALRGRCANCRERISLRYPLIELLSALLSVAVVWQLGVTVQGAVALIFTWSLIALSVIDIDHQLLPDNITLPLLWLGLIINTQNILVPIETAVWGALFGYLSLWSVYWLFKLLTGKEGMGYGDFKLLAALGAWLGWQALPLIIVLSSLVGAVVGLAFIVLKGRDRNMPIPFGPYLAIAGWIALLWGDFLIESYLRFAAPH